MLILRHLARQIIEEAGWSLPVPPIVWSARLSSCAGLFVTEKNARDIWVPQIRLSVPLLRRLDRPWPIQVCGCLCHHCSDLTRRILEHEMIHYKLWKDGEADWGHTPRFKQLAKACFQHQSTTHGIGVDGEEDGF